MFYVQKRPLILNKKATNILNSDARKRLAQLAKILGNLGIWSENSIEKVIKDFANQQEINLKQLALPFSAAITGTTISPGIFEVAKILGQQETMGRLKDVAEF